MREIIYSLLLLCFFLMLSCSDDVKPEKKQDSANYKEPLINANKALIKSEDDLIQDYIDRYRWEMTTTGTGLRYMIYFSGKGDKAKKGNVAIINFTISLLNGDTCYTSEEVGVREFLIGKGGVVLGIEEGILLLRKGDKAKFIIPSHLAFGLVGDMDKVPAKSTLVYDLELIELKQLN